MYIFSFFIIGYFGFNQCLGSIYFNADPHPGSALEKMDPDPDPNPDPDPGYFFKIY